MKCWLAKAGNLVQKVHVTVIKTDYHADVCPCKCENNYENEDEENEESYNETDDEYDDDGDDVDDSNLYLRQ